MDIVEKLRGAHWADKIAYEAADEIELLRKSIQWQPIETAPMDGTEVMVRYILTPLSSTHQEAYFHDEANDGNNEWVMSWSGDAMESNRVTHWMPRAKEPE